MGFILYFVFVLFVCCGSISESNAENEVLALGCYKDNTTRRVIGHYFRDAKLSTKNCIEECRSRGFMYAAMEVGIECFCGSDQSALTEKAEENECNFPCHGETNKYCGGNWRFNLYSVQNCERVEATTSPPLYIGCFKDQAERKLVGHYFKDSEGLTHDKCMQECQKKGFLYAGLQVGEECFCGSQQGVLSERVNDAECNFPCHGDKSQMCGSIWRMTLFSVGKCGQGASDHMYLGCFKDKRERTLSGHSYRDAGMTPEMCVKTCKEKGYFYAGIQVGLECFCGNERSALEEKVLDDECNFSCSGDQTKKCGSIWKNTVYSTSNVEKRSYRGCYKDNPIRKLNGQYSIIDVPLDGMTPAKCLYLCGQYRFMYAGLQVGVECFCGNQPLKDEDKALESDCNFGCTGDYAKKCGGNLRNTVYSTGYTIEEVEKVAKSLEYVGCYKDELNRKFNGYAFKSETMIPEKCVEVCYKFGYLYAGLQAGSECYCGNGPPEPKDKHGEDECNARCFGDYSRICGGLWRNSLYSTKFDNKGVITGNDEDFIYKGCYKSGPLSAADYHEDFGFNNTPKVCVELCRRYDKPYAALSFGTLCICLSKLPLPETKVNEDTCNTNCPRNNTKYCGGSTSYGIYETGTAEKSQEEFSKNYVGCYNTNDESYSYNDIYKYTSLNMSVGACITFCKYYGYLYASISEGDQCNCGDKLLKSKQKTSDSDCNISCPKDGLNNCGGHKKLSVYTTGNSGEGPKVAEFGVQHLGCYNENIKLIELRSYIVDYENQMTPKKCVYKCSQLGFKYTGLLAGSTCLCGNREPTLGYLLSNDKCSTRCTGQTESICGGKATITVYKTTMQNVDGEIDIRSRYLGCFKDQGDPRSLIGSLKKMPDLTPWKCIKECKHKNYLYAGLQVGSECYCGDQHPKLSQQLPDCDCNFQCGGDLTRFCGGIWANTLYHTSSTGSEARIADIGFRYLGCYRDQENPRQLSAHYSDLAQAMTPVLCVNLCKSYGYYYAGLQYGDKCFCGDSHPVPLDLGDDIECNSKCNGDVTKLCGGHRRNTIYITGNKGLASIEEEGLNFLGCYKDEKNQRRFKDYVKNFDELSPTKCVALCKSEGYLFAGVQNGSLCMCGNQYPSPSDKLNNTQCNSRCIGNMFKICGGVLKNVIYQTELAGTAVVDVGYQYLGCFTVANPIQLNAKSKDFNNLMTPQKCISFCKEAGHLYSGLHNGVWCYCGDSQPSQADKTNEGSCSSKCLGDINKICGGPESFTAYVTAISSNESISVKCMSSKTTVNGGNTCSNSIVFEETFSKPLSLKKWKYMVELVDPDESFAVYTSDTANTYTTDDKLIIKPSIRPDNLVKYGKIDLLGCTSNEKENCVKHATSYSIIPPIQSARIITRDSFSFKYGKIEIRAKLPVGDWIIPEIWLEPKEKKYGPDINSGQIHIALARGNQDLSDGNLDLSCHLLENGVVVGVGDVIKENKATKKSNPCWAEDFHNYTLIWTPENMIFYIDGEESKPILPNTETKLTNHLGFSEDASTIWRFGSNLAPFDEEFYIHIGLSVGGGRHFPDGILSNGRNKPWRNRELRSLLNFWRALKYWEPTWVGGSVLEIDHIRVSTL